MSFLQHLAGLPLVRGARKHIHTPTSQTKIFQEIRCALAYGQFKSITSNTCISFVKFYITSKINSNNTSRNCTHILYIYLHIATAKTRTINPIQVHLFVIVVIQMLFCNSLPLKIYDQM